MRMWAQAQMLWWAIVQRDVSSLEYRLLSPKAL